MLSVYFNDYKYFLFTWPITDASVTLISLVELKIQTSAVRYRPEYRKNTDQLSDKNQNYCNFFLLSIFGKGLRGWNQEWLSSKCVLVWRIIFPIYEPTLIIYHVYRLKPCIILPVMKPKFGNASKVWKCYVDDCLQFFFVFLLFISLLTAKLVKNSHV